MARHSDAIREHPKITVDPAVMGGKPCIAGTRITVETIIRRFAERYTIDEVLADYPTIGEADVLAALEFAADVTGTLPEKVG